MADAIDGDLHKALLEEYKEAGHLHRLHVGLMFGQITVFLGASGALLHRMVGLPLLDNDAIRFFAVVGGFLAILFLVLHERVYAYSKGARNRAEEIQVLLGMELYKSRETDFRPLRKARAAPITRFLYGASLVLWILLLVAPSLIERRVVAATPGAHAGFPTSKAASGP